jgi:hypothetical protein
MITTVCAFAFAVISPGSYALLFAYVGDRSALIDFAVVVSCVILAADVFRHFRVWIFLSAAVVLLSASLAGLFVHFRDSGESGPLPYEWLNRYYVCSMPLLLFSAAARLFPRSRSGGA